MKKLHFLVLFLISFLGFQGLQAQSYTVPECSDLGSNTYGPMNSNTTANSKNRTAFILPAAQLTAIADGTITATYFKRTGTAAMLPANSTFRIYLKNTSATDFGSTALDWAAETSTATLVYDADPAAAVGASAGYKQFAHSTNFSYTSGSNMAVFVEYTQVTGQTTTITWNYEYTAPCINTGNSNTTKYLNTTSALTTTLSSSNYRRPLIGFDATFPPATAAPACTALTAPANAATGVSVTPTLTWAAVGGQNGATSYKINMGTTPGGTDVMNGVNVGNVVSYTLPTALNYNTTYYVTVIATNNIGDATGCTETSFTTVNIPCPTVTAPAASASNQTLTPTFTWNAVTGATGYVISMGTTSGGTDILNAVNVGNVTTWNYSGPALSNSTTYYYTISATDGTTTSSSCSVRSFTTVCGSFTAPYTYDVENATATTNSTIGNCWSSNPSGTTSAFRWDVDASGSTPSSSTGPSGAFSGTKYFYAEASSGTAGAVAELLSPFINISSLTTPMLQFYYHMYGSTMGELRVDVWDGAAWNNDVWVMIGQQHASTSEPWTKATVNLSTLTITGDIQIRFRAIRGTDFYGDMSLDDISVMETPTCIEPTGVSSTMISSSTGTVTWTAPATAPANGYTVYYSTSNTAPTSATVLDASNSVTSTTTTATISGLAPATTYYVWVRSDCSATDHSIWTPGGMFTTACATYTPTYLNDFATYPGNCWSEMSGGDIATGPTAGTTSSSWLADGFLNNGTTGAARINNFTSGSGEWLISPTFNLSAGTYVLTVDYGVTTYSGTAAIAMGSDDVVAVLMSTDGGASWTSLQTWTAASNVSNTTNTFTYDLSSVTGNSVMFAFYAHEGADDPEDYNFYFDNFQITSSSMGTGDVITDTKEVKVYPNPFTDVVNVSDIKDVKNVTVIDMSGRVVKSIANPARQLSLGDLKAGMYILKLDYKDGTVKSVKAVKR